MKVDLSKIDYRARPAIELLNSFFGVSAYDCCSGHIEAGVGMGKPIKRYVPGLESNGNCFWTLDVKQIDRDIAIMEFKKGFIGYEGVQILPINEIYTNTESIRLTSSYLRFACFNEPRFKLVRSLKQTKNLAQKIDCLYKKYESLLGLREVTSHGFATKPDLLSSAELTAGNINSLIQKQIRVDEMWEELADLCISIKVE